MDTKRNETFDILAGPNRDVLFDACKYVSDKTMQISVDFTVAIGYTAPKDHPDRAYVLMPISDIRITGIQHEDESGESFNLQGHCKAALDRNPDRVPGFTVYTSYNFKAYYNTKRHRGSITLFL